MNKRKTIIVATLALASLGVMSGVEAQQQPAQQAAPQLPQAPNMTFFVTSAGPARAPISAALKAPTSIVSNWQCAPKARIISGGRIHPESCRLIR
jgi:hypothetical protein